MGDHQPHESPATMTVTCKRSASVEGVGDVGQYADVSRPTLADVEAWCIDLRARGAQDDLVFPDAQGLKVTLELP